MLRRNLKDLNLCPIIALMTWLSVLRCALLLCSPLWLTLNLIPSRLVYGVTSEDQAVFCNLSQTEKGRPLVRESFRKMLSVLIESKTLVGE